MFRGPRRRPVAWARAEGRPAAASETAAADPSHRRERGYTDRAGRVTAAAARRSRKVRTPKGRTLGKSQAAKADGKWHRKETAGGASREAPPVRVKRWGKSPPATVVTRRLAKPRPVQDEADPADAARRGIGYVARAAGQPAAQMDGRPRQNPAYRPATERAPQGAFSISRPSSLAAARASRPPADGEVRGAARPTWFSHSCHSL